MRLITCSNSAPNMYFGPDHDRRLSFSSPGGLVPMMTALLSDKGGHWVFTAAEPSELSSARPAFVNENVSLQPVWVPDTDCRRHYRDYCVKTLTWLFHYLQEIPFSQESMLDSQLAWDAYRKINQVFADALLAVHDNAADEIVLINDLHFLLVPQLFVRKASVRNSRLIYFHHVPWCEPEYFGILPQAQRDQILKSLLCADIVGFHSRRWAQAFLACCARYIPTAQIDGASILLDEHVIRLAVSPGTIDKEILFQGRADAETEFWQQRFARQADGRRVIARVDRLDLWKNHPRGFSAYETLLSRNPHLVADLWFCAIASPTRLRTGRHLNYQAACEAIVNRINERFGGQRKAVDLLYPDSGRTARHQAIASLSLGSVTLVNPIWDGLNLVAKESVLLGEQSQVVLSANAGVHDQLGSASWSVNPFDEEATAAALARAIATDTGDAARRAEHARGLIAGESAVSWLDTLLKPRGVL
jgi:trehalose 6-phosphate synthase